MFEKLDYIVGEFFDQNYWKEVVNNFQWKAPKGVKNDGDVDVVDNTDESDSSVYEH